MSLSVNFLLLSSDRFLITEAGELFSELQLASELSNTRSFHFFIGEGGGRGGRGGGGGRGGEGGGGGEQL